MSTLRFLLLEDNLLESEAIQAVLINGSIDYELLRVDTHADFVTALKTKDFDLILAAYALPDLDGIAALETARNLRPETPFIFVSASLGEELAIEALKQGATDYVIKQRLERLVPCVQRALREAQERRERQAALRERQWAEAALRQNEARLRAVAANLPNAAVFLVDTNLRYVLAEGKALAGAGMTSEDLVGKTLWSALDPALANRYEPYYRQALGGKPFQFEHNSHERHYISHGTPLYNNQGEVDAVLVVSYDISERKRVEDERKQAEAAQREGEERYRTLFESIDEGFCVVEVLFDPAGTPCDHRILRANPAFERQTGITNPEGKTASELIPGIEQYWNDLYAQVVNTGESIRIENYSDALARWFNVLVSPVGDGAMHQVALVFSDISERKQAESALRQSEARFRTLISASSNVLYRMNADWSEMQELQGGKFIADTSEPIHDWLQKYIHPDDQVRVLETIAAAIQNKHLFELEHRVRQADGTLGWTYSRAVPLLDSFGEIVEWFGEASNISDRKRIEQEREQILQREQTAREAAERANRVKDEFLAVLSHELRSPLNPILGWTRLLQNGKLDPTRQIEALKTIERNAKLQSQLIEDLLDISCIMQGKLSLTVAPISLTKVISAALETVRLTAEAKNITLALDIDPKIAPVSGDSARLQQVMWNLLTNAVKFTPNGGQVTIELRHLDHLAQIRVIDTGKGINPQFLPHVFEYFRQEDSSTTRKFGGLGLGLAIVRQIVEMHGGTVKAESRGENQGATFIVQLSTALQVPPGLPEPTRIQTDLKAPLDNIQILLVDDEPDTREFQAFLLEQSGAKVTAVASGLEALQVLDRSVPDVLVSDLGMPDMDGYMLIEQIRSRSPSHGGAIVAIALTAYAAEVDRLRAIGAGFQTFLTKPVEAETLVKSITSLLNDNQ